MTTKEYLNQISRLNRMINNKLSELAELKELTVSISSVRTGERVQTSPNYDSISSAIAKIDEKEREIDLLIDKFVDLKAEIKNQIDKVPKERYRFILDQKYIHLKTIREISDMLCITDRGCKKAHKIALEEFEKMYYTIYCDIY